MQVKNPKELFVYMLSDVRYGAELTNKFLAELTRLVVDPDVKDALEARTFAQNETLETLDKCFTLINEKPMKVAPQIYEVFVENFRRDFAEIQVPAARRLFILAKIAAIVHLRIGEYVALIAAADWSGHDNVGLLLETCLADHLSFVERTKRLILPQVLEKVATA